MGIEKIERWTCDLCGDSQDDLEVEGIWHVMFFNVIIPGESESGESEKVICEDCMTRIKEAIGVKE